MKTTFSIPIVLTTLLLLGACGDDGSTSELFCENSTDCDDNATATFCDIDKAFPGTELENECIAPPSGACNRVEKDCGDNLVCSDLTAAVAGEGVTCTADKTGNCGVLRRRELVVPLVIQRKLLATLWQPATLKRDRKS